MRTLLIFECNQNKETIEERAKALFPNLGLRVGRIRDIQDPAIQDYLHRTFVRRRLPVIHPGNVKLITSKYVRQAARLDFYLEAGEVNGDYEPNYTQLDLIMERLYDSGGLFNLDQRVFYAIIREKDGKCDAIDI